MQTLSGLTHLVSGTAEEYQTRFENHFRHCVYHLCVDFAKKLVRQAAELT